MIFFFSSLTRQDVLKFQNPKYKRSGEQPLIFLDIFVPHLPKREEKEIFERKISRIPRYIIHTHTHTFACLRIERERERERENSAG